MADPHHGWPPPYLELLRCPRDGSSLLAEGEELVSAAGRRYQRADGTVVLLPDGEPVSGGAAPGRLQSFVVERVYATHNQAALVRDAVARTLTRLGADEWGLDIGCGSGRLHPHLIGLDLRAGPAVDVACDAHGLPFADDAFACVITQEVLEHLADPQAAMREIRRTLRPGGILYLQVPFIIGYHPGPTDLWRFTREGIRRLVEGVGLEVLECGVSVGAGTGMYRIAVEFVATVAALFRSELLYKLAKGAAALLLRPLVWLDPLLRRSFARDRIPGGYYVIAEHPPAGHAQWAHDSADRRASSRDA